VEGRGVVMVPYRPLHVPKYHEWMTQPALLAATASDPLSLEEEYDNQVSWRDDEGKLTFILLDPWHGGCTGSGLKKGGPAGNSPDVDDCAKIGSRLGVKEKEWGKFEVDKMVGDVNSFFSDYEDDEGRSCSGQWAAELEIMIADPAARGKGIAREALQLFMRYISVELQQVVLFFVKIGDGNKGSLKLFKSLGFVFHKHVEVFAETELRLPVTQELRDRLETVWKAQEAIVHPHRLY